MATTVEALVERAPAFAEASILRGWAGFYEVTPDDNPLLGWTGGPEGLAVAAGFSGHGFMQGPAIGRCMAELLLRRRRIRHRHQPLPPLTLRRRRPNPGTQCHLTESGSRRVGESESGQQPLTADRAADLHVRLSPLGSRWTHSLTDLPTYRLTDSRERLLHRARPRRVLRRRAPGAGAGQRPGSRPGHGGLSRGARHSSSGVGGGHRRDIRPRLGRSATVGRR